MSSGNAAHGDQVLHPISLSAADFDDISGLRCMQHQLPAEVDAYVPVEEEKVAGAQLPGVVDRCPYLNLLAGRAGQVDSGGSVGLLDQG